MFLTVLKTELKRTPTRQLNLLVAIESLLFERGLCLSQPLMGSFHRCLDTVNKENSISKRDKDYFIATDIAVNKSRTTFITSEISSFPLLIGRTMFFH